MQVLSALPSTSIEREPVRSPHLLRKLLGNSSEFRLHDAHAPGRAELERYVARCFARAYHADVTEFAPLLLELRCARSTSGVAGIRLAASEPLFLEHYLDQPVEQVAGKFADQPVLRSEIAELCNLAALRPGACQLINIILAATLHAAGFRYATLAGTAQLERIIRKQHFSVTSVAAADPARLGAAAASWGSYYESRPNVLLVDLPQTMQALNSQYLPTAVFEIYADTIESLGGRLHSFRHVLARLDARAM